MNMIQSLWSNGTKLRKSLYYLFLFYLFLSFLIGSLEAFSSRVPTDFGSFYDSGLAFRNGLNPYSFESENIYILTLDGVEYPSPNMNPPFSLFLLSSFSLLPVMTSYQIWRFFSAVMFVFSILILIKVLRFDSSIYKLFFVFALGGLWHTIQLGQLYIVLLLAIALALFFCKNGNNLLSGLFFGLLIAMKPNFALLITILFASRHIKLALFSSVFSVFFSALPLFWGTQNYLWWMETASSYAGIVLPSNDSIVGLFSVYKLAPIGFAVSAIGFSLVVLLCFKYSPQKDHAIFLGILSSMIFSPITWAGYVVVLAPFLMNKSWGKMDYFIAIILTIPTVVLYSTLSIFPESRFYLSWLYGYAYIIILAKEIITIRRLSSMQQNGIIRETENLLGIT